MQGQRQGRRAGFTVLELLVVLAIAAIVLSIGVPSLQTLTKNARIVTTSNELLAALYLTRSEAVKRRTRVTMCRSADQQSCDTDTSREWEHGWIIFVDDQHTGQVGQDTPIIRVGGPAGPRVTIRTGGNYNRRISFQPIGTPRGNTGLPNDTFRICDDRGPAFAKAVVVARTGRARVTTDVDRCSTT